MLRILGCRLKCPWRRALHGLRFAWRRDAVLLTTAMDSVRERWKLTVAMLQVKPNCALILKIRAWFQNTLFENASWTKRPSLKACALSTDLLQEGHFLVTR